MMVRRNHKKNVFSRNTHSMVPRVRSRLSLSLFLFLYVCMCIYMMRTVDQQLNEYMESSSVSVVCEVCMNEDTRRSIVIKIDMFVYEKISGDKR